MKVIEQNFSFYKYFLGVKFTCVLFILLLQSCDNSIINNSTDGIVIDSFKQGSRNKRNIIAFIVNNKLYKTIEIGNDVEYRDYYSQEIQYICFRFKDKNDKHNLLNDFRIFNKL